MSGPIVTDCTKVVYLVRAQLYLMKFICSYIHKDTSNGLHREYYLYFVPLRLVTCEKILEEEKVHEFDEHGGFSFVFGSTWHRCVDVELNLNREVWVMNIVTVQVLDTLPIIFERGLIGVYHDWCESLGSYHRSYMTFCTLIIFFSRFKYKQPAVIVVEIDRILRPGS